MANVLGELFGDIANAIREKTGATATMKPAEFPDKISGIEVGGGSIGGGDASQLKIKTGAARFSGSSRHTFTHGLGERPDFIMVYFAGISTQLYENADKYPFVAAWGFADKFDMTSKGAYICAGSSSTTTYGIDEMASVHSNLGTIYCPDDSTFMVGKPTNANGMFPIVTDTSFNWIAISGIGGSAASADVRYVTFMSDDGAVEYGKKAVAVGDDCADPIARGVFSTPTRESTAQYNYDFAGWATTPNGAMDANWGKSVTEDRTVYANFAAILRYYTITYLDTDGSVLKTESLAYGAMPSYMPTKDGASFDGWNPVLATVMGDASYTAKWLEKVTFANGSWADISRICEAGEAADYFAIGDSRVIPVTIDGTTYNFTAKIVGMSHDEKKDGGKAGITCLFYTPHPNKISLGWAPTSYSSSYMSFETYNEAKRFINYLPADLVSVVKYVKKNYNQMQTTTIDSSLERTWIPCGVEVGSTASNAVSGIGTKYEIFNDGGYFGKNTNLHRVYATDGTSLVSTQGHWVRDVSTTAYAYTCRSRGFTSGNMLNEVQNASIENYLCVGFCI